jgi:hypothetical protein
MVHGNVDTIHVARNRTQQWGNASRGTALLHLKDAGNFLANSANSSLSRRILTLGISYRIHVERNNEYWVTF